jgi:hypothetical protein
VIFLQQRIGENGLFDVKKILKISGFIIEDELQKRFVQIAQILVFSISNIKDSLKINP